ncbi:Nuclear transport factor 2 [Coemansia interrupta]|uniref:Nuclear transport factor 2 n=1 Tax=Coemansia interrupta TaxID=1126814 RepID=A0A9W8HHH6_9FUNG|nr:Nuclear transport factor 2 [Coemansia interrupta]
MNNNVNYPNNAGTVNNPNNAGNVNNPNNPNDPNANKVDNTARINAIAKEFVNYYYQTFDADRKNLAALYRPMSMMTWEGVQLRGGEAIIEKLASLPFQKVGHKITTTDAQQSLPHVNALVIMVTGQLLVDEETKPQQFSQTFQLVEDNGFFVYNDVFRLNYA